jgi:hypothetical protein
VVWHAKGRHQRQRYAPQLTAQLHDQPLDGLGLKSTHGTAVKHQGRICQGGAGCLWKGARQQ